MLEDKIRTVLSQVINENQMAIVIAKRDFKDNELTNEIRHDMLIELRLRKDFIKILYKIHELLPDMDMEQKEARAQYVSRRADEMLSESKTLNDPESMRYLKICCQGFLKYMKIQEENAETGS